MKTHSKKKKIAIVLGLSLAALGVTGAAIARPPAGAKGAGGFPGMMIFRLIGDLELTEQQELKAIRARRAIGEQAAEARKETHASLGAAIDELGKPAPDRQKLHGIADQSIKRFSNVVHAAIDQLLELHATFTPEQRETLAARAKEAYERKSARMERFEARRGEKPGKMK